MSDFVRKLNGTATLQSSLGRELKDVYKSGSNNYSLIFATVTKVNFVAGTVDVTTIQKYDTLGNAEGTSGELSARVPSAFNGVTDSGFRYGETFPVNIGDLVLIGFIDGDSTRPVVINVYKTPDTANALSSTSATTGNPSQGELYNDTMSYFRLYPGQVYDYVSGDGHREVTFSGGSFFKTASGETGDGILNNYGYGYDDLYKTDLVSGEKINPYSSKASQMLLLHGAATSPNKTAVLFDEDNSLSLSRYVVGEDGRGDINLKADKSVEMRYQNKDWVPDGSDSNSSGFRVDESGADMWSGDYKLSIDSTNGIVKSYKGQVIPDGDVSQSDLDALDKKAQGYAEDSLNTANDNINSAVAGFNDTTNENYKEVMDAIAEADKKAQGYAEDAKSNATIDLENEVKERQAQVDAVDLKAKGYADEAKQDAMDAASSADGVIRKTIEDTNSELSTTIQQNKIDADGKIDTAQTTATQALDGLSTKVEKTEYDTKTDELSTQINATSQTATQSKQDIVDIKNTASQQESKINSIVSDATQTQQTISDIQSTQSSQSDKINQITTDVNGTKQEITDIQKTNTDQDSKMATIQTTVDGITTDFSDYKKDADGRITIAQTTATNAVDGLKTKVEKTDFDTTTGNLTTQLNTTTQTANQSKQDIVDIKNTNASQDSKINSITSDATQTKQTISDIQKTQSSQSDKINQITTDVNGTKQSIGDIQTTQNTQTTNITNLTTRANGFDTTIQSMNNQINSLGQINQLFNTEFSPDFAGWSSTGSAVTGAVDKYVTLSGSYNGSNAIYIDNNSETSTYYTRHSQLVPVNGVTAISLSWAVNTITLKNYAHLFVKFIDSTGNTTNNMYGWDSTIGGGWVTKTLPNIAVPSGTVQLIIDFETREGSQMYLSQPMMVFSQTVGDYVQGNYNNNARVLAIEARADKFDISIKGAQTSADTANNAINNLSVGGRNLLLGTRDWTDNTRWNQRNTVTTDTYRGMVIASTAGAWSSPVYIMQNSGILQIGKTYTFSTYVRNTSDTDVGVAPYYEGGIVTPIGVTQSLPAHTDWIRVYITFQCVKDPTTSTAKLRWEGQNSLTNGFIQFAGYKLEEGNKATDWTPAPEDVQSGISSAQTSADGANNQLSSMALPNLFPNSDFDTDYGYRTKGSKTVLSLATKNNIDGAYNGTVSVTSTGTSYEGYWANNIQVQGGQKYSASVKVHYTNGGLTAGKALLDLWFIDSTGARISSASAATSQVSSPYWVQLVSEGFTAPANAVYLQMSLIVNSAGAGQVATFTQPVLVASSKLLNYTPNDDITTTLKMTASNFTLGIDSNGNLISGITGNAQSLSLNGATIYLNSKTVIADDFTTRLLTAQDATIGNTLTIGSGGSIQSVLGGKIWDFTPNSGYYLVDNTNPWFQVDQTGTFIMNSLGDLEFNGTITAPDKGKLPDGSTPYAYPTQTTDGSTTVTWTNKLTTTTSLGIQGLRVDQQNYNRPESSGGFVYVTGHGIFTGMDQVNPRGVMTPDGNLYVDTVNLNSGYSWKTTQVPTAVSKIWQGVYNGTANMYLDAAGYVRIANAAGNSGGKIYVNGDGVQLFSDVSTLVLGIGHSRNGYLYYESKKSGSGGSDVKMAGDGAFFAQTSATKYKTNIQYDTTSTLADRLMTLDLASWNDKGEEDMRVAYKTYGDEPDYAINLDGSRYVGLIAEDLVKANLEEFVVRDPRDGTVESIEYDKIGIALIPAVRQQREMINELRLEIERLKDKIK